MQRLHPSLGKHISRKFDEDLEAVRSDVLQMGGLVEEQLSRALSAVFEVDSELGERVVTDDYKINRMEVKIDEECTTILALRQPTASDLRMVIAIIKTITDLERIGDEAEKMGRMAMRLATKTNPASMKRYAGVRALGRHVSQLLRAALDAFARLDVAQAVAAVRDDENVDHEYAGCMRELVTYMMEDTRQISEVMDVVWCARALERIGDHAKNICEYTIYLVGGKDVRHTRIEDTLREARNSE